MAGIVGWARSLRGSWGGKVDVLLPGGCEWQFGSNDLDDGKGMIPQGAEDRKKEMMRHQTGQSSSSELISAIGPGLTYCPHPSFCGRITTLSGCWLKRKFNQMHLNMIQ